MSNVFVISTITAETGADKQPRLAYASLASTANTITASHDSTNVAYLYDGMTTLKWRPANASPSIQFDGSFVDTDYVGIAGSNWSSSGCTITVKDSGGNILGEASGLDDNQPVLFVFDKATYTTILIEFSCSNTLLEVGEIYFGESMLFPRNVSVGYQPGRWTSNDEITTSMTEGNQFAASTIRARGTSESFTINFVPTSFMETTYKTFINAAKGRPVFFLWNKDNYDQSIFGYWNARRPSFTSSLFSSISIDIDGVA